MMMMMVVVGDRKHTCWLLCAEPCSQDLRGREKTNVTVGLHHRRLLQIRSPVSVGLHSGGNV